MFSCRKATHLISKSLDRELGFRERIALRLHLAICHLCRRYRKQIRLIDTVARLWSSRAPEVDPVLGGLSPGAKERITSLLRPR